MSALAIALRRGPAVAALLVVLLLAALLHVRTGQRDAARASLENVRAENALFAERVRAESERAARRFADQARRTERAQQTASQEVSRDYQQRISDLRRRLAALQLRPAPDRAHPGGAGGGGDLPGLPGAAGGSDAAAGACRLPFPDAALATEQAIRLEELQRWVRRQQAVGEGVRASGE
ncbi:hypothetical protein [Sphingosinicella terrae]|uniref:hypothetical protein n=1 Tax=Sphingosinicella terrae TaxID=2172047 RepID=UPI000E0D3DA7|nr:hypothetical protein [Sphingosinicella terrae]